MITLTENAAKKIQSLAAKKGQAPVLRVKVGAGGCSGMSYEFEVSDVLNPDDAVFEAFGAKTGQAAALPTQVLIWSAV